MKNYAIAMTIIAVLALGWAGYLFWQSGSPGSLIGQLDACQKDKTLATDRLSQANGQLEKIKQAVAVFKAANESFMIPGDLKALTVGSKEAAGVAQLIGQIADSQDRMLVEKGWSDFKSNLRLNALFGFYRNLAENLNRVLEQPINN